MVSGDASMTLVFKRAALERLADPAAVFADAREWTEVVGLVSDEAPERLSAYADREGIDPEFISSARGQTGGLAVVRQQFPTERHVFVGTTDDDRGLAESLGWEYLPVSEAAAAADWSLAAEAGRWQGRTDEEPDTDE
jgi:hypothetical protein